jgi:hypothetical protein
MTRWVRRLLPSPAMVVALTALFVALGGSAYALVVTSDSIRNNTIKSADVRNGGLLGKDVRRDGIGGSAIKELTLGTVPSSFDSFGTTRWAVVTADGLLARSQGTGPNPVARTGPGRYQVIFDGDVRGCAYAATVGDASAAGPPQGSEISTSSLGSNVNAVAVRTEHSNGTPVDRPFHLILSC